MITYRELLSYLKEQEELEKDGKEHDSLNNTITIYDAHEDEYFPVESIDVSIESGVIEDGTIVLLIKSDEDENEEIELEEEIRKEITEQS